MEAGFPEKIAIVGLGLIGGSLALAIKHAFPEVHVVGVDFSPILELAREKGAIDEGFPPAKVAQAVQGTALVFLATPINTILELIPRVATAMSPGAILTDVGSTKEAICRRAQETVPRGCYFIGGHPLAGTEGKGFRAADPFLFQNALYILTPLPDAKEAVPRLTAYVEALGAIPVVMDPERHDEIAAYVSHLPQLTAVALVNTVGRKEGMLPFAAGGFRDLTRIASSPYEIWRDILATNAGRIERALEEMIRELSRLRKALRGGLEEEFVRARALRASIPKRAKGFSGEFPSVRVVVPDRIGALAEVTGALGKAGINIKDLELMRVREGIGGTFRIYVEGRKEAEEAARVLRTAGYEAEAVD
ncbi:prephenate dehydrogenase [Candidatus Acetothermia bacterium]|nr:MAG: prephenate dehydrogenase [Candidatus Acetothermia bacterium]